MKYEIAQIASEFTHLIDRSPDLGYEPNGKHILPGVGIGTIAAGAGIYKESLRQKSTRVALIGSALVASAYELLFDACVEDATTSLGTIQNCQKGYLDNASVAAATLDGLADIGTTIGASGLAVFSIYKAVDYVRSRINKA